MRTGSSEPEDSNGSKCLSAADGALGEIGVCVCVCQAVCTEHGSSATANRLFVRFCKLRSDSELEERAREREKIRTNQLERRL